MIKGNITLVPYELDVSKIVTTESILNNIKEITMENLITRLKLIKPIVKKDFDKLMDIVPNSDSKKEYIGICEKYNNGEMVTKKEEDVANSYENMLFTSTGHNILYNRLTKEHIVYAYKYPMSLCRDLTIIDKVLLPYTYYIGRYVNDNVPENLSSDEFIRLSNNVANDEQFYTYTSIKEAILKSSGSSFNLVLLDLPFNIKNFINKVEETYLPITIFYNRLDPILNIDVVEKANLHLCKMLKINKSPMDPYLLKLISNHSSPNEYLSNSTIGECLKSWSTDKHID